MRHAYTLLARLVAAGAASASALAAQTASVRPAAIAAADSTSAWTRITYLSGETVYLEVGNRHGLTEHSTLDVVRGGLVIAHLRVTALSSSRAACEMLPPPAELVIGDSVRFVPVRPRDTASATPTDSQSRGVARTLPASALRGRAGVRYLVISADGDGAGGLTQPAYDLRLDGERLGGTNIGISADVRAQRTQYATTAGTTSRSAVNATRVYQAALSWIDLESGLRVAAGRQAAGALSSVGLFDGLGIDLDRARWSAGGFVGSQPDDRSFGLSGRVREYGVYGAVHTARDTRQSAAFTLGGIGSYVGGDVDREYAFARFTSSGPRLSLYATQELDFNRGWKRAVEHTATTPTATFASVHFTPARSLSLFGGFDNRRSVRLYRDYQNPEIAFDDAFREGTWGGISLAAPRHARLSVDVRESHGGTSGTAASTTMMASLYGLTSARLGLRVRGTSFSGSQASGQLLSGALDVDPWGVIRVEANGGRRSSTSALGGPAAVLTWWGVDADIGIGRSLYILLSTYREREASRGSTQTYASLSWRF